MSIIDTVKKNYGHLKVTRTADGEKVETEIRSLNDAANYLAAVKDQADRMERGEVKGDMDAEVKISTATEMERREYLNYCLTLVPDKYIKHKILLFLRINPYSEKMFTDRNGRVEHKGVYLSKKEIARAITARTTAKVTEQEVDKIEKEAVEIVCQSIRSSRANDVPLIGANQF